MLPVIPYYVPLTLDEYEQEQDKRLAEGRSLLAEGKKSGLAEAIVRLVGRRFGSVPETFAARIEAVGDSARLQQIFDAAIDATSISQLESALAGG